MLIMQMLLDAYRNEGAADNEIFVLVANGGDTATANGGDTAMARLLRHDILAGPVSQNQDGLTYC